MHLGKLNPVVSDSVIVMEREKLVTEACVASRRNQPSGARLVDDSLELYSQRRMFTSLANLKGLSATSVITLLLPPGEQIPKVASMLAEEYGTATNIKSKTNRHSVLDAITTAQQKLKLYRKTPPNGLVILAGTLDEDRRISLAIEPPRAINQSLYLCDNCFHLEHVLDTLADDERSVGYIIISGDDLLIVSIQGTAKKVLKRIEGVNLAKKHNKGGQSSVRFERLAQESRHNYRERSAEQAKTAFIQADKPNISSLFVAGPASMKDKLLTHLDQRLRTIIVQPTISTSYGLEEGLKEAIEVASERLGTLKSNEEKRQLITFFELISKDIPRVSYGLQQTLYAIDNGLVDTLIVDVDFVAHLDEKRKAEISSSDDTFGGCLEVTFIDYVIHLSKKTSMHLVFVTGNTSQGSQFIKGFGGIGSILRYDYNFNLDVEEEVEVKDDLFE